jgi:hypothetical protein
LKATSIDGNRGVTPGGVQDLLRTYLDRGIRVAINTDVSSAPYDPFVALYGAVGRKT